jgi:hexosaminidase
MVLKSNHVCAATAVLTALGISAVHAAGDSDRAVPVVPAPQTLKLSSGYLEWPAGAPLRVVLSAGVNPEVIAPLTRWLQGYPGIALEVVDAAQAPSTRPGIRLQLHLDRAITDSEGYRLTIDEDGVAISAREAPGLLYGAVTLWQLIAARANAAGTSLPFGRIVDAPHFVWRGLMLDSARHYQSPEFIRRYIDWMALHKLNILHWHLTDDQGWRLEIRRYPRLTSVGAWRVPAGAGPAQDIDPKRAEPRRYGGYYDQDTVRQLVAYAAARNVTIVPEIEMPGHATAAIVAYPELGAAAAPQRVPADWGIYSNLFNVEEDTFAFLENVLAEVIELFPGPYVHVGGDEVVKDQWRSSTRVQQRMREQGIADETALQGWFIARIGRFLAAHDRRLVGWDEILDGGVPQGAIVMSWRGLDGARKGAVAGHDTVLAAWPTLYFDNRQGPGADEPPGRGRILTLADVYGFETEVDGLSPAQQQHVIGMQANVWTEHIRTEAWVEWMSFPRAAAVAELAWSAPSQRNLASFRTRLERAIDWYRALGYHYATTDFAEPFPPAAALRRSQELETCTDKLVLNLEDDAPVRGERARFLIDIMNPCWIWRDADLSEVDAIVASVGQVPFNFQIGADRDAVPLRPPHSRAGELEVRLDHCDGEIIAEVPLATAATNVAVTTLPRAAVKPRSGAHDLCFLFTARELDPVWAIDRVELVGTGARATAAQGH